MRKLVIFLIRKRLGVRKYQHFRFTNQKSQDEYYFTDDLLMKISYFDGRHKCSEVGVNWLLDEECKIELLE